MSFDLEVIPQNNAKLTWESILPVWRNYSDQRLMDFLGSHPTIVGIPDRIPIQPDRVLVPPFYCTFELTGDHTIGMHGQWNQQIDLDERSWVEDYGRNLDAATQNRIIDRWKSIGYQYCFTSDAGRAAYELTALKFLVCAVAMLCEGVIVNGGSGLGYDLKAGIYSPEVFMNAVPLMAES